MVSVKAEVVGSGADHPARLDRTRQRLQQAGLDAVVVFSPDSQYWLCGFESFISGVLTQALVVPVNSTATPVLIMWDADAALARSTTTVADVRVYRFGVDDPVEQIQATVRDLVPNARTIGFDAATRAVPHTLGAALVAALAPANASDCTALLADLRMVKTVYELDCMRRAGSFADAGLRAAVENARVGVTERELAATIEHAMRMAGSDYPSIPTELTSGPRSVLVHGTPSHRHLEAGDLVHVEIGGVEQRYNTVGLRTFYVGGGTPPAAGARLYDVARRCLELGLKAIRPGVRACEVEAPALDVLRQEGVGDGFQMRFGYGTGVGYPPTWLDPLQITRTSQQQLQQGMTFVLHACLLDEATSVGVVVGGTYAVEVDGVEQLAGGGPVALSSS